MQIQPSRALPELSWMAGIDWQAAIARPDYRAAKVELLTVRALKAIDMTDEMASAVEKIVQRFAEQCHAD